MIDHISVGVADLKRARQFYDRVLAALGYERVHDIDIPGEGVVGHGYGWHGQAVFWIGQPEKADRTANRSGGNHVAFRAATRKAVRAFHRAALKAGGKDNGKPGLRPEYHANYYGAFAFDPEGNKIEACCHHPE